MLEMFGLEIIILFVVEVGSNKKELIRGAGSRGIQIDKNVLVSFLMFKFRTAFKPHTSGLK